MLTKKDIIKCSEKAGMTIAENAKIDDCLFIGTIKEWEKFNKLMEIVDEFREDEIDVLMENSL